MARNITSALNQLARAQAAQDKMRTQAIKDAEKFKLIKIANSEENKYDGPIEIIKTGEVEVNSKTRKLTIIYTLTKGKRKIEKTFTHQGIKYKIYEPWEYTSAQKKYTAILTEEFLNSILTSTDSVIEAHKDKILAKIPFEMKTESILKVEIDKKYNEEIEQKESNIKKAYEQKISPILETHHNTKLMIEQEETKLNDIESNIFSLKRNLSNLETELSTAKNSLFARFKQKKINEIQSNIDDIHINLTTLSEQITDIQLKLDKLSNLSKKEQEEIDNLNEQCNKDIKNMKEDYENKKQKELEETISCRNAINIKDTLSGKPSIEWIKEERAKLNRKYEDNMTLREWILKRDNYTCRQCGNSMTTEPNLLLEVDHIAPVSKWGPSIPENLQTLCWKCNRAKSSS